MLADQFSAWILELEIFRGLPTTEEVRAIVRHTVEEMGVAPEHVITDMGQPFRHRTFRPWCERSGARHLFGRLGQHGSIPFVERVIGTIKQECTTRILVPFSKRAARAELERYKSWYNRVRPHERLKGATPDETYRGVESNRERCYLEPRPGWPLGARRAASPAGVVSQRVCRLALRVRYLEGRKHLPVVRLERVA